MVYAEKCPNSRGVRRALDLTCAGGPAPVVFEEFTKLLADKATKVAALILTGNYPGKWTGKEIAAAASRKFTVLIDTLPNDLTNRADVLLPSATWAQKSGTFESATGRLQSFEQAIPAVELERSEGQIALDLLAQFGLRETAKFDGAAVRKEMGGVFVIDVQHPPAPKPRPADMQYVPL
jgi:NADH-quinone oxidoreductase subunit G